MVYGMLVSFRQCLSPLARNRWFVDAPWLNRHILRDFFLINAILQLLHDYLRIEVHPNQIHRMERPAHERVCVLIVLEQVDLRLENVPVWVGVVHREAHVVVGAPEGGNPVLETLPVGEEELWE